jgi:EspG family
MVNVVLGSATAVDVEPLTAPSSMLADAKTANQLGQFGINPVSARTYANLITEPKGWVELTATERHPGGTTTTTDVAAGVLDSSQGRIVSIPRRVNGELYGSFLPGSPENLQRALDGLVEFLPSGAWFDRADADTAYPD